MKTSVVSTLILSLSVFAAPCARSRASGPVSSSLPPPQCSVKSDDVAIRDIPGRWKAAYNAGKAAQVAALYAVDAYYLTQHFVTGVIRGRADIQAYVQRGIDARYRIDSIEVLATQCSDDFGYAITRYKSTNAGRSDVGVNLVVLRKIGDRWMIVAHEAAVPDPATAVQKLREK